MKCTTQTLVLLLTLLSAAFAQSATTGDAAYHATFVASNGDVIKLDTRTGTLETPRGNGAVLQDCSNKFQVCLTDHHGFAFAYFRKCNDAGFGNYKSLSFSPKVVSVLDNTDVWMVFDASPNYLFHYAYSKGIVGIYLGPTASFDFRRLLHEKNFPLANFAASEYRRTTSSTVAGCIE